MRKTLRGMKAAMAMAVLLATGSVQAQVLDQVPSDALFVIKFNKLAETSAKAGKFAEELGLAAMQPKAGDPLGALKDELKITQGLDETGELAIAMVDPANIPGGPEKALLVLIPVSDYSAFLKNFAGGMTDGAVTTVKIGNDPEDSFIVQRGKYAALSPSKAVVEAGVSAGLKPTGISARELEGRDAVLYANVASLRTKLAPEIEKNRDKVLSEIEQKMSETEEAKKFIPVVKVLVGQLLSAADSTLRDAEGAVIGASLTPDGISTTVFAEFTPGSYLGNVAKSLKNSDKPLLSGLPAGKYLVYGGSVADPAVGAKVSDDFLAPVLAELAKVGGDESKAVDDVLASFKELLNATTGQTFGLMTPTGALGQDPILQSVTAFHGDAAKIAEGLKSMTEKQQNVMKAFNIPGANLAQTTVTPAAKQLDGVTFDLLETKITGADNDPMAAQQKQMFQYLYGPDASAKNYVGQVDSKTLLLAQGLSDLTLSTVIAAAKTDQSPLSDVAGVKLIDTNLPKNRMGVFYIAIDEIATTGLGYARQFGFPIPVQLPPDLAPVGVSVSTEGTALKFDTFIPTSLVRSLVAAGLQAAAQMGGGGGGL